MTKTFRKAAIQAVRDTAYDEYRNMVCDAFCAVFAVTEKNWTAKKSYNFKKACGLTFEVSKRVV